MTNQRGVSLSFTVVTTTVLVSAVAYTVITQLPRLRDESRKMGTFLNYKTLITGVNDYMVNALRERWCLRVLGSGSETIAGTPRPVVYTDLFPSESTCRPGDPLEAIVTDPGNLERLLWTEDTVGVNPPGVSPANTIMGLNRDRIARGVTSVQLNAHDVRRREMNFFVGEPTLASLTEGHPLSLVLKGARRCLDGLFIRVAESNDTNNLPVGDEKRIEVEVRARLKSSFLSTSCSEFKLVQSKAFYSFYPRALNTYGLIVKGDLSTNLFHEYNAPVYVAGDLRLPPTNAPKATTSVFYEPVTLGFKDPNETGKLKTNNGVLFTFDERGEPRKTRQDRYENFRGFLGGLTLDPTEDKGMRYLFGGGSTPTGVDKLEQCIEFTEIYVNPHYTAGSILAYQLGANGSGSANFRIGLTRKNIFRQRDQAPRVIRGDNAGSYFNLLTRPDPIPATAREFATVEISDTNGNTFSGTLGAGAGFTFRLNAQDAGLVPEVIGDMLTRLNDDKASNYRDVVPMGHLLQRESEVRNYLDAAQRLKNSCDNRAGSGCVDFGYTQNCDNNCGNGNSITRYDNAKTALRTFLQGVRNDTAFGGEAELRLNVTDPPQLPDPDTGAMKSVLNIKTLSFEVTPKWARLAPYVTGNLRVNLKVEHYSSTRIRDFDFRINLSGNLLSLNHPGSWVNADNDLRLLTNRLNPTRPRDEILEVDCPEGVGVADWDLDMSESTAFAWNYANTQAGAIVDNIDHSQLPLIIFSATGAFREGHSASTSKSIVNRCVVPPDRTHVYGFYVCETLEIQNGRTQPLYMIGTFIVKNLVNNNRLAPVIWQTVWDARSAPLIYHDLKAGCGGVSTQLNWRDFMRTPALAAAMNQCSAVDLVNNGPNNFTWTTVDPEIGLARPSDVMTSQKVKRRLRWIVREDSRQDVVK